MVIFHSYVSLPEGNLNRLGNICWIGRDAKGRDAVQANARDRGDKAKEYTVIRGYIPTYSTGKMFRSDRSTEPFILLVPTPSMIVVFYPCRVMMLYRYTAMCWSYPHLTPIRTHT